MVFQFALTTECGRHFLRREMQPLHLRHLPRKLAVRWPAGRNAARQGFFDQQTIMPSSFPERVRSCNALRFSCRFLGRRLFDLYFQDTGMDVSSNLSAEAVAAVNLRALSYCAPQECTQMWRFDKVVVCIRHRRNLLL